MAPSTRKTKKVAKKSKATLKVDSPSKIPQLEKILKDGKITIVLVFADWCGHCHKFQKNIWNPMCNKPALHNRVAVRDDMIGKTSLANANFKYLPSVLVVDEKGNMQTFTDREGAPTNAMPTPKNLEDMEKVVNVPVTEGAPEVLGAPRAVAPASEPEPEAMPTMENLSSPAEVTPLGTPSGTTYTPTPAVAPAALPLKGGALFQNLQEVSQGLLPVGILGGLRMALRGGKRKSKTQKQKRMIRA